MNDELIDINLDGGKSDTSGLNPSAFMNQSYASDKDKTCDDFGARLLNAIIMGNKTDK